MHVSIIFGFLIVCLFTKSTSSSEVIYTHYYFQNSESNIIYNGGSLIDDCNSLADMETLRSCPVGTRLNDNVTLEGEEFDSTKFIGWQNDNVLLAFEFPPTHISRVDIYFYNNPSQGFGLPPVQQAGQFSFGSFDFDGFGIPIQLSFTINSVFSQDDNNISVVSIAVGSDFNDAPYSLLRIIFDTSSTTLERTFISEVKLFSDPQEGFVSFPPIQFLNPDKTIEYGHNGNIPTPVELSCTVANNGSFVISWTGPNGMILDGASTHIYTADLSRTSILRISDANLADNGAYTCEAVYTFDSTTGTTNVTLNLDGSVSHLDIVYVTVGAESASLYCNFNGYLPASPNVIWRDDEGTILEDSTTDGYNITTTFDGPGIANIGGITVNNGVTSVLTIFDMLQSDIGSEFTCSIEGTNIQGTAIRLMEQPLDPSSQQQSSTVVTTSLPLSTSTSPTSLTTSPSTPTSPTTPISPTTDTTTAIAIGASIAFIVLILIAVIVVVILLILIVCRRKKLRKYPLNLSSDPMYTEVLKPSLPPLPDRLVNDGYATINLPEDVDDKIFPMKEMSASPLPNGGFQPPTKISSKLDFLQPNPMYTSRDNIAESAFMKSSSSLPFLDRMEESDYHYSNSNFNIYAEASRAPAIPSYHGTPEPLDSVYSEDLDPSVFRSAILDDNSDLYQVYRSVYTNPQPLQRSEALLEVKEKNIRKLKDLGMGQFGEVELAHTVGLSLKQLRLSESNNDPGVSLVVAVKRLKSEADETMREAFENEIKFMARLNHENVVRLLGVSLGAKAFIVMEYMEEGDLNNYLKALKFVTVDSYPLPDDTVDVAVLVYISLQVAAGMRYLAGLRYIHRDLATRNILVGQDFKVKIADFGMSQQLYSSFYYRIKGRAVLPIRWMANECFYGRFSEKTDVWAYGIVMWEIFTLCRQQPYENFTDQELIDDAIKGDDRNLLSRPDTCPEEVYHVMLRCWINNPDTRATFEEIHGLLLQIHAYNQDI